MANHFVESEAELHRTVSVLAQNGIRLLKELRWSQIRRSRRTSPGGPVRVPRPSPAASAPTVACRAVVRVSYILRDDFTSRTSKHTYVRCMDGIMWPLSHKLYIDMRSALLHSSFRFQQPTRVTAHARLPAPIGVAHRSYGHGQGTHTHNSESSSLVGGVRRATSPA